MIHRDAEESPWTTGSEGSSNVSMPVLVVGQTEPGQKVEKSALMTAAIWAL